MQTVEIEIKGGSIQDIKKPENIKVIVKDYDFPDKDVVISEW